MKISNSVLIFRTALAAGFAFVLSFSSTLTAQEASAEDARASQWLEQMAASFRNRNYDGVLVSNRGGKMRSVRVVHVVRDGMESERLEYLDGDSVEVHRDSHPIDCIHTGKQLMSQSSGGGLFSSYANATGVAEAGLYQLRVMPESRVAGRPVSVVAVLPNDAHRYGHRLFLDQSSRLLLKSEVLDKQGNVLESFQFTQIKLDDEVDEKDLEPSGGQTVREDFHAMSTDVESQSVEWRLSWLPPGFVAATPRPVVSTSIGNGDSNVDSVHYTDGFALFSVFLQARENEVEAFETRVGSTLAYVTPKKLDAGWASVTVVGELPLATAVQIAQSLEEDAGAAQ